MAVWNEVGSLRGPKGDTGATPDISVSATVGTGSGTPSVQVTEGGTAANPTFAFAFNGLVGDPGPGLAAGGSDGYVAVKASDDDYDTEWVSPAALRDAMGAATAASVTAEASARQEADANLQSAINGKQATVTGAATTVVADNLAASRALVSDGSGKIAVSAVTSTELGYLDGVTGAIQTQLDGKAATGHRHSAADITSGTLPVARGGTGAADAATARANLGVTLGNLGVTATAAELNYMDGVTANVQTQLNGKASSSHTHDASAIASGTLAAARIPSLDASKIASGTLAAARIPGLDASKITSGTISIDRLPQAALERLVVVDDDTARYALTTSDVQLGDVVKVESSGLMYYVKDAAELDSAAGYEVFTAGSASSVPWSGVTGKPSTFTPSSHTHPYAGSATAGGAANSVANSLTISLNGTSQGAYNGSAAKSVNITASSVGAAAASHSHAAATTSAAGFMSATDKAKLDGISASADANQNAFSNVKVGGTTVAADTTTDTLTLVAGSNVSISADAASDTVTISSTNTTYGVATTGSNGLMSADDKEKLDGIAAGANKYTHPAYTARSAGLYKVTVDATGHVSAVAAVSKSDITALGVPASDTNTWIAFKGSTSSAAGTAGYVPAPTAGSANRYFRCDGTWAVPPDTNTTYSNMGGASSSAAGTAGLVPAPSAGQQTRFLRGDGTWAVPTDTNTTYSAGAGLSLSGTSFALASSGVTAGSYGPTANVTGTNGTTINVPQITVDAYGRVTSVVNRVYTSRDTDTNTTYSLASTSANGLLRQLSGSTSQFMRGDGTWATPPNTTYSNMTGSTSSAAGKAGLVPAPAAGAATRYLRCDGTWQVPPDTNTTYTLGSFGVTATAAELNKLDGVTTTATQLNYLNTLTSNVQTQLNGKAASSHNHDGRYNEVTVGSGISSRPSSAVAGDLYIDLSTGTVYRWSQDSAEGVAGRPRCRRSGLADAPSLAL